MEGKRAEMETMDMLLQRRERETQEGGNLLKMLTDDLQTAKEERCACSCVVNIYYNYILSSSSELSQILNVLISVYLLTQMQIAPYK